MCNCDNPVKVNDNPILAKLHEDSMDFGTIVLLSSSKSFTAFDELAAAYTFLKPVSSPQTMKNGCALGLVAL